MISSDFKIIYETPGLKSVEISNYTKNLKLAIEQPLNGMRTRNRIDYVQNYKNEPEFAIVLDPKNKKSLFGYNFWAIRLTEFVFWNEVKPSFMTFKESMGKYFKIEKRL